MEKFEMVVKTLQGLENVLAKELEKIGAEDIEIQRRAVACKGNLETLYKANLCCRTALRILKPIAHFSANNPDEVYEKVKELELDKILSVNNTFSIETTIYSDDFKHSKFVAYRVKDAVADYFNEKYGKRPTVSVSNPEFIFNLHIAQNDCTLSLDSSGESLHKRGYRVAQTEAPINEVLAAGMLLMAGWDGQCDFYDPMCGSGTILIEAAMIALNINPGIYRKKFAFEDWKDYDAELFNTLATDDSGEREFKHHIYGSDILKQAIEIAQSNVNGASLQKYISLEAKSIEYIDKAPSEKGLIIVNPPYGERIGETKELFGLYAILGERLKHVFTGWEAWVISSNIDCLGKIGLKPSEKVTLINSTLECEFRHYEMFEGKHKDFKRDNKEGFKKAIRKGEEHKSFKRDNGRKEFRNSRNRDGEEQRSIPYSEDKGRHRSVKSNNIERKGSRFKRKESRGESKFSGGRRNFSEKKEKYQEKEDVKKAKRTHKKEY